MGVADSVIYTRIKQTHKIFQWNKVNWKEHLGDVVVIRKKVMKNALRGTGLKLYTYFGRFSLG